ncbi:MAG: LamG domain-containing protein [Verrucomicrobia bacterium]|jgi:hypothetical protein|nr:LamG domain-containing protein [Verrucomicrobiota bacterium]
MLHTGPNRALHFGISDAAYQVDSSFHAFEAANVLTLNAWQHVAAVYDQPHGTRRLHVNGFQVAEEVHAPIQVLNAIAHVTLGGNATSSTGTAFHFDGLMDEFSFYHSALRPVVVASIGNPLGRKQRAPKNPHFTP